MRGPGVRGMYVPSVTAKKPSWSAAREGMMLLHTSDTLTVFLAATTGEEAAGVLRIPGHCHLPLLPSCGVPTRESLKTRAGTAGRRGGSRRERGRSQRERGDGGAALSG